MGSMRARVDVDRSGRTSAPASLSSSAQRATPSPSPARRARAGGLASTRYVVASGAIMPARAPASMDILHTVMRSSIESARMVEPRYSNTWPVPPGDADLADDGEDQVLGRDSGRQSALDIDGEGLGLALQQALRGEHVAHLGAADAEGEGAEGAVGARVAVAADDGHARPARAELGTDDVHDAAPRVAACRTAPPRTPPHSARAAALVLAAASTLIGTLPNTCSLKVGVE